MHSKSRFQNLVFGPTLSPASAALAIMLTLLFLILLLVLMNLTALPAQAQTFKVLYNFTGGADGSRPDGALTLDAAGNLYGTTIFGGVGGNCAYGCGTVFKLSHKGSNWILDPLYDFSGSDGAGPLSNGVIFGPDGILYGATMGGGSGSAGVVYDLRPKPTVCKTALCPWTETVLHNFTGYPDGAGPYGNLTFDQAGNLYGVTSGGGYECPGYETLCGTVFELTSSGSGWTESILYYFRGNDGSDPDSPLIFDQSGNLYGTTSSGGTGYCGDYGCGTVYELTPSGSGWTEKVLYSFQNGNDGKGPTGVIFDKSGNLYGTTGGGGQNGGGVFFKLAPSSGQWTFTVLYSLSGTIEGGPGAGGLVMDTAGNFYGAGTSGGQYTVGSVFKLTLSNGSWTYTSLHDFTGGSDGDYPFDGVTLDAHGNLYGTAYAAGAYGNGVVWEITP